MNKAVSNDGTTIAYETFGSGPAVVLVDGALGHRELMGLRPLAQALAGACTAVTYDRRGRGESGNTLPYAVEREVEDIAALIDAVGGKAALYGISSGAALVLEAALALGDKVTKVAFYEAPYNDDPEAQQAWNAYVTRLSALLAEGRDDDAVGAFMELTGASPDDVAGVRQAPIWPAFAAVAPTLAYDHTALLGEYAAVPVARAAGVAQPALVMSGSASYPFMEQTARTLARALPRAELLIMEGQSHEVDDAVLAPVLIDFFSS